MTIIVDVGVLTIYKTLFICCAFVGVDNKMHFFNYSLRFLHFLSYMFLIDANEQKERRLFSISSGVRIFKERDWVETHKLFQASFEISTSPKQVKEILELWRWTKISKGWELIIGRTIPHNVIHFKLQWLFTVSVYHEVPAQCEHGLCSCYFWGTCYFLPMGRPVCISDVFSTYSIANLNMQQKYSSTRSITHFHQV
jgi:hypothetical protein